MTANYYPDGLAPEAITALQRAVDDELRREGYPVSDWPEPLQTPRPRTNRNTRPRPADRVSTASHPAAAQPVTGEPRSEVA